MRLSPTSPKTLLTFLDATHPQKILIFHQIFLAPIIYKIYSKINIQLYGLPFVIYLLNIISMENAISENLDFSNFVENFAEKNLEG